ncbi:hypothetical protein [Nitrospirillum pindoramense]|nr:hypothetical protein [Nitrospirillum amazonense]
MKNLASVVGLALLAAASLTACASQPAGPSIAHVTTDKFSKVVSINGVSLSDTPFGGIGKKWYLRSWVDKDTKAVTHQLYVWVNYVGDWKFYQSASDDTAQPLAFTSIARDVSDCSGGKVCILSETFGLDIPDSKLRATADKGFQVKIMAKTGEWIVLSIIPEQIQKQLTGVDQANALISGVPPVAPPAVPTPYKS